MSQPHRHITTTMALQFSVAATRSVSWMDGFTGPGRTLCGGFFAGILLMEAGLGDDDRVLFLRLRRAAMVQISPPSMNALAAGESQARSRLLRDKAGIFAQ